MRGRHLRITSRQFLILETDPKITARVRENQTAGRVRENMVTHKTHSQMSPSHILKVTHNVFSTGSL